MTFVDILPCKYAVIMIKYHVVGYLYDFNTIYFDAVMFNG